MVVARVFRNKGGGGMMAFPYRLAAVIAVYVSGCIWAVTVPAGLFSPDSGAGAPLLGVSAILKTNLAALLVMLAGLLTGGTSTVLEAFVNGVSFGGITRAFLAAGKGPGDLLIALGPHLLPEMLGFWVCGTVGLHGIQIMWSLVQGKRVGADDWIGEWRAALIGVALTVTAAVLEGAITSRLVSAYLGL